MLDTLTTVAIVMAVLVPSVVLHEVAHGVAALRFGDDTARRAGRLTLNPLAHVDPFGTVILPILLAVTTGTPFGYARPVPVVPSRMRRPRDHGLLTSLAGPATNIALAAVAAAAIHLLVGGDDTPLRWALRFGQINVILAAFNLIPIPPLDGSALVERVLPRRFLPRWHQVRQYSMAVLLLLVLVVPGTLSAVFGPALRLWTLLLPGA